MCVRLEDEERVKCNKSITTRAINGMALISHRFIFMHALARVEREKEEEKQSKSD